MPYVHTIYYIDVDFYRYFIGREDQSVNESVMISRLDQQYRVNYRMIDVLLKSGIHFKYCHSSFFQRRCWGVPDLIAIMEETLIIMFR